jgi:O-antigen ligase
MTITRYSTHMLSSASRTEAARAWERLRYLFFAGLIAILWVAPNPNAVSFREDPGSGREGNAVVQLIWLGLLILGLVLSHGRWRDIRPQFDRTLVLLFAWCLFTVPFAIVPDVSLRRLIFTIMASVVAILLVSGLENPRAIIWLLLGAIVVETALKYAFVFGMPHVGRHNLETTELHLVGLWRGQYAHKNVAGAVCAIELFVIYAARRWVPATYLLILAGFQLVFLAMSGSKTPLAILLVTMVLSRLILSTRNFFGAFSIAAATVFFINAITVMTVVSETMRRLAGAATGDPSFTGRTEIWSMLLGYISEHPVLGAGFMSFWQISSLSPAMRSTGSTWARLAIYGHQGYLDLTVTIGVPGLVIALLFLVARPAADIAAIRRRRDPVLEMYVCFWLFALLQNGTESNILGRADAVWIFQVMGIAGIKRARVEDEQSVGLFTPVRAKPSALKSDLSEGPRYVRNDRISDNHRYGTGIGDDFPATVRPSRSR